MMPLLRSLALGSLVLIQGSPAPVRAAPGATPDTPPVPRTQVLDLAALGDLDGLVADLADRRVVFVGETHDRYEHHLNQLAIIRGLHRQNPRLAIGLEFFQQPFQGVLDRYLAGELDEAGLLRESEYFTRWRYDYRLYRPILQFAREQGLPLIALNVPRELTERVSRAGLEGLTPAERAGVPAGMDRGDATYQDRLRGVFKQHPGAERRNFQHFLDAQVLWDEGMAERAARFLREHPEQRLVVLAGAGHMLFRQGIPDRLQRRLPAARSAVILQAGEMTPEPGLADYLLYPQPVALPKGGLLGVLLDDTQAGAVKIKGFADASPARQAGLQEGDQIRRIGAIAITHYPDVRIALLDGRPGDQVPVEVLRPGTPEGRTLQFQVTLY
jgi:uncharacterized iron-regulated protein